MGRIVRVAVFLSIVGFAGSAAADEYDAVLAALAKEQDALRQRHGRAPIRYDVLERTLIAHVHRLARAWIGTPWGRGSGQATAPGADQKINCGTFVGRVLNDVGFEVDVRRLQRQPSAKIIETFLPGGLDRVRAFPGKTMETFLAGVRDMGPGLFIVGLDQHVGFLLQTDTEIRYLHSNYVDGVVVDEPADNAVTLVDSRYRVVGKILSTGNLRDWLSGKRIEVIGKW